MNKSLTPLIISFSIIIMLTIIVLHSHHLRKGSPPDKVFDMAPPMRLSSYPSGLLAKRRPVAPAKKKVPDQEFNDPDPNLILAKAKRMLAEGDQGAAEDELRTLLVFDPENFPALSLLGGIFYYSQRYDEAEVIYRKQVRLKPESPLVYSNLGSVLAKKEKLDEAIKTTAKATSLDPKSASAHLNLAGMYAVINNREAALKHFRQAYGLIGPRILPLAQDVAFNNIRNRPEFTLIIAEAKKTWQIQEKNRRDNPDATKLQTPDRP